MFVCIKQSIPMKKFVLLFSLLTFSGLILMAQYVSSQSYNLGVLAARSWSKGPAVDQSSYYTQGTFYTKSSGLAFTFNFSTIGHKKGLNFGPVFSLALGGENDQRMVENPGAGNSDIDGKWSSDFGLLIDWKMGFSINYSLPDKETSVGLRYFNWYMGNTMGSTYSNADDPAALGLIVNWKKFGFSYSYGSDKIPGVLVNSPSTNVTELEARYQLKYNKDTKGGMMVGVRSLTQKLMRSSRSDINPDTRGNIVSVFLLFH